MNCGTHLIISSVCLSCGFEFSLSLFFSSCLCSFLLSMFDDSIEGIYETMKAAAMISKQAGGIGLSVHNVRAAGSYIRGTNGTSNGQFNET